MRLKALLVAIFVIPLFAFAQNTEGIYIKLGESAVKKVDLLIFTPQAKSGKVHDSMQGEFYKTVVNNLTVSAMFNIFEKSYLGIPELTLEIGYQVKGDQVTVDARVLKKEDTTPLFTEQVQGSLSQSRQLAHALVNGVLKQLTGTPGPFLNRFTAATDRAGGPAKEIYYFDWDGANPTKISNHKNLSRSPAWSPDGTTIAYTAYVIIGKNGQNSPQIITYDITKNRARLLTSKAGNNSGANFSPDGQFVYLTSSAEGNNDIYKISATTGEVIQRLTKGPLGALNVEPAVSPDGSQIAFASDRAGNTALYVMNADGTNVKRLTQFKEFANAPSWSPDGKQIAFAGQDDGTFDIFVINADGSNLKRITQGIKKENGRRAKNEYPSFSSDGRYIMYTSDRTGKNQIYITNIHGTADFRITNDDFNYYSPKWSWK